MSDLTPCECCGKLGQRHRGHVAPEGWYFGSFTLSDDGDHDPGDLLIVSACSEACRDALWTKMAGHRWDTIEQRVDVPTELRRAARLQRRRLLDEARRIREGAYAIPPTPNSPSFAGETFARILEQTAAALDLETEREIARRALEGPAVEAAPVDSAHERERQAEAWLTDAARRAADDENGSDP